jgi:hypothetical protein
MKLRIHSALYIVSLALAGGIVLNIIQTIRPGHPWHADEVQIRNTVRDLLERGAKTLPNIHQWRHHGTALFWEQFRLANFTGFRAPDPGSGKPRGDGGPVEAARDVDLGRKIDVLCITSGGDYTRAVVHYLGSVEVPAEHRALVPTQTPAAGDTHTTPWHHLQLGDHLWKPLDDFYLVAVADDAESVIFENRAKEKVDNDYPQQVVHRTELGLPEYVTLFPGSMGSVMNTTTNPTPRSKEPPSEWRDLPKTTVVGEDWHVSRKDLDYINQRGNKLVHKDMSLDDYSGLDGSTKVQGVRVRRLGQRVRGLGIQERDILISINGIKVKNRAQVILESKRLWRQGVRRFELVCLRRGQETTIAYRLPGN